MNIFYLSFVDLRREDGPVRHTLEVCENLQRLGHRIMLFVPGSERLRRETKIRIVGAWMPEIPILGFLIYYLLLLPKMVFFYFKFKPHLLYSRSQPLEIVITHFLKRILRMQYVVEINGAYTEEMRLRGKAMWKIKAFTLAEGSILQLADRIITVTSGLKDYLIRKYRINPSKIKVISNGANTEISRPLNMERCKEMVNLNKHLRYLCFIGSLQVWHGVEYAVKAMPKILSELPQTRLLIIGEGERKEMLEREVARFSLEKAITFTGEVPFQKIPLYIGASELCLAPYSKSSISKFGFAPFKLRDYMACGKAIITTNVGGLKEFIENYKIGTVVPSEDSDKLSEAILRLMRNEELRKSLGERGRRIAVREFSWSIIAQKVEKVCLSIQN